MPIDRPKRALPGALVLSLAAHGVLAGLVFQAWQDTKPAASVGRQKGALQVTLRRDAPPAAKPVSPSPDRTATTPAPRKQKPRPERPAAPPPTPPKPAQTVAEAPPPAPTEPKPGARFASLFAPIVHAPIGQAGWSTRRVRAMPEPAPSPEQSIATLRAALSTRFASLAEQLRATQAQLACELVIDIERRIGQLECEDAAQQAFAWGHLQGPLTAGLVSAAAERLCLRLTGTQVLDAGCTSPTP